MVSRRFFFLLPILALALLTQSCTDTPDLMSPVEPSYAKGGKGKPPPTVEPQLREFWVYDTDDPECPQMIHMVVEGTFLRIGKGMNHDHFFNAVRDDDPPVDTHFEFAFGGPKTGPTEFNEAGTIGHADACFSGERKQYTDESGVIIRTEYFPNYPATDTDGAGTDPFAISPSVLISQTSNSTSFRTFEPLGVVEGGVVFEREDVDVTSSWHPDETFSGVRSYALHKGELAPGKVFVDDLSITNVSCNVTTKMEGRGKNKTQVTSASVSAQVTLGYGATAPYNQYYWGEGHFQVVPVDGSEPSLSGRVHLPQAPTSELSVSRNFGADLSDHQSVMVEFVVDFLNPVSGIETWPGVNSSELYNWVYDPGENGVFTTAGLMGGGWLEEDGPSATLDDGKFPVAHSNPVTVVCR